ncbi:right-handed parallel beta-helix repeat-containing protein, partial [Candidatus Micrarchaeota archaeon]|nr:right-handed parallel beta-helix repeat-containing protein [Candidatus Micrarchaeota archaeon]
LHWEPLIDATSGVDGTNGSVYELTEFNNKLYAGGSFSSAGGHSSSRLAQWDGTSFSTYSGFNGIVRCSVIGTNEIYFGGMFTNTPGGASDKVVKYDGSTWTPVSGILNGPNVISLAVYNSTLYAGGSIYNIGGTTYDCIAVHNGSNWEPVGTGTNGEVHSLYPANGYLYIGGEFSRVNGIDAYGIAYYDGTSFTSLNTIGYDQIVKSMTTFDNFLVAAGSFTSLGGVTVNNVAKWNGSTWSEFGDGLNGIVRQVLVFQNELYAIGEFSQSGSTPINSIAKWTGTEWEQVAGGLFNSGLTICEYNNTLYAGGGFTSSFFSSLNYIARLAESELTADAGDGGYIISGSNIGGNPTASGGLPPYSYSWSPSTGLSSTTVANPTASITTTMTYEVEVTDSRGCNVEDEVILYPFDADCATPNAIVFVGETLSVDKTYTNQNIIIDDYLLIDEASVEFDNCIIYMEEDAYIKLNGLNSAPGVYDGQLQLINGTTIQACGDNMWGEIHLNGETATLIMDNATIRDAKKAIQFDGGSITSIDESTFDANYENIVVEYQAIVHLDDVEIVNSDFIGSTTMLSPYSSEERSLSAVKIVDCDDYDIQIGDIGKGNSFDGFETGIYVEASRLVILGNDFVDCNYGVDVVDMNTSRIASNTFSSTSDPGKMAIQLTSSGGSSNAVQVNYNEISGCFTGISVENNSNLSVEENTIELGEPEDGAVGIKLMNCANYLVRSNTVTGEDADNEEMMGYYVDISTNGTMKCNSVDLVGQGFWFGGTCTGTEFGGNEMHDCYNQFVLEDGGVIGTQGNSSYPHDNLWGGTYGNKQTLAIWSDGRDSEFHVQTGSPYEPTDNNHIPSSPDAYDVLISNGAANSYTGCSSKSASESGLSDAEEQMLFNNDNPEARWINDYGLFTTISQNMLLTEANHALSGWFTEKTLQSCGKLYLVGKAIGDSLYQDAFLLMNNCATTNHADSLLKKYYELY